MRCGVRNLCHSCRNLETDGFQKKIVRLKQVTTAAEDDYTMTAKQKVKPRLLR